MFRILDLCGRVVRGVCAGRCTAALLRGVRSLPGCNTPPCRQHEYEADAIACAALARRGMPMEHMADSLRLSGWRPKLQLRVGPLQLELLSGGEGPSKGELTRQASKALSSAAKRDGEGEGSQLGADPELDLLANFPMTERLWLRGAPPAEQVTILVRLMQSHPPVGQRVERIRRLAAQHIDREAERAQR